MCILYFAVEALHLAHLMASHGYFFPIDDHVLTVKCDNTYYRFQVMLHHHIFILYWLYCLVRSYVLTYTSIVWVYVLTYIVKSYQQHQQLWLRLLQVARMTEYVHRQFTIDSRIMVLEPGIHTMDYVWRHHVDVTEPTGHINNFTGHRINGILCYLVMTHDSTWTALTGARHTTVDVMNVTVMLVYSKETVLEVELWWYVVPFYSTNVLNSSALRAIWQDTDIVMRFGHLLWLHSLTPTETLH